jgi:uncharacterized RDD family membrane protein YckC
LRFDSGAPSQSHPSDTTLPRIMEENPYQAPKSHIPLIPDHQSGIPVPVGKGVRFLNLLIDYAAFFGFSMMVGFAIGLSGNQSLLLMIQDYQTLFGVSILLSYYLITEGAFARSVGKFITGCKVVDEKGGRPSFLQILGRTFSRLIPFEALSFLGSDGRGLHDSLAKTYVVQCR